MRRSYRIERNQVKLMENYKIMNLIEGLVRDWVKFYSSHSFAA